MNSRYNSARKLFLIFVFVSAVAIGTAVAQSGGRVIVLRVPNFGWNLALHLQIDGKTVANGKPGPMATRLREIYIDFAKATGT